MEQVTFKCKPNVQFRKLMTNFCERNNIKLNSVSFLYEGNKIKYNQTPEQLEVQDGEIITAI